MAFLGFLWRLLLTILVEGLAIIAIFRRLEYGYYSVLCNLLTNPALNLALAGSVLVLGASAYYPTLIIAEVAAVFVEAFVYRYISGLGAKKAFVLSAFLNALSYGAGLLANLAGLV